ncbi:MAG TPA: hypothetical protein VHD15_06645 [Hyphomicrobiales bacterium]|nr:hypothetical protein [Hyphomicrobiales bacterium]
MTVTWKTEFGLRAVRHEPPGIAEALDAAEGFCSDPEQQIEIAAALLGADVEEVRAVAARQAAAPARRAFGRTTIRRVGQAQAVVVERRKTRRSVMA